MPVRIHGRLLAELGAMLGLCLAAAGCQNSLVRNDAPLVNVATDTGAKPSRPLLSMLRGESREAPTFAPGQVVSMSRPIPVDPDGAAASPASNWNPIQRTSGEQTDAPPLAQNPPPADSPNVLPVDGQAQQPAVDPQLNPPTPLLPTPVVELPPPGMHDAPFGPHPVPREFEKHLYPTYIIEPPDILLIQVTKTLPDQPAIRVTAPVAMDGTINLGIYGQVRIAGLTVEQAREVIGEFLRDRLKIEGEAKRVVSVEVAAYNSKVYYIITDGGGYGQQVARFPATGNETVLDALANIGGLPAVSSKKHIWLARATPDHTQPQILPIDWCAVSQQGSAGTNYQIFPGDRLYVSSDPWVRTDTWIARRLAPIQNVLGTILLGSTTVNSLKGKTGTSAP